MHSHRTTERRPATSYSIPKLENKKHKPASHYIKKKKEKEKEKEKLKEKKGEKTNDAYFEGRTSQLTIPTSSTGRSAFPVFTWPILSTTSIPLITCPKTV
jgi:hypothetical protein